VVGRTLAHCDITAILGAGGMGEVYRARDTKLGREVTWRFCPRRLRRVPTALRSSAATPRSWPA
jgi:hypothetical protein